MKRLIWVLAGALFLVSNVAVAAADDTRDAELEKRLEEARKRLDEAAREVGEISGRLHGDALEQVFELVHSEDGKRRAVLGINIGEREVNGEVTGVSPEGVVVLAVTPGGPAEKAGIEADDIITRLNDSPLKGGGKKSNDKLVALMEKVEPGEKIELEYLRDGKKRKTTLEAGEMSARRAFAMMAPGDHGRVFKWHGKEGMPGAPVPPMPPMSPEMFAPMLAHRWGGMEMVQLTPKLGEYFGTDKGLLVVRVPESEGLELEEGDVILKIGDREPRDVGHAMRILRSYAAGESTEIEVMRKKRKRKLSYKAPDRPAMSWAPAFRYNFVMPDGDDADFDILIERDDGEGADSKVVIEQRRKIVTKGDAEVIFKEEDIGT